MDAERPAVEKTGGKHEKSNFGNKSRNDPNLQ